jgi:hypothetical protein
VVAAGVPWDAAGLTFSTRDAHRVQNFPVTDLDPTLARIAQGVELHHHQGRPDAARDVFARIWDEIGGERGDALHVCVLAHAMADVQDDVRQELIWDQRALAAADQLTDAGSPRPGCR